MWCNIFCDSESRFAAWDVYFNNNSLQCTAVINKNVDLTRIVTFTIYEAEIQLSVHDLTWVSRRKETTFHTDFVHILKMFIAGMLFYMLIDLSARKPYSAKSSASAQRCLLNRHNVFLSITFLKFI